MNAKQQKQQQEHETQVVESMTNAAALAVELFGAQNNLCAAVEIYDYLKEAEEDDFIPDLKRVIEHAKSVYVTPAPTPEQVFALFERIYPPAEETEE